MIERETAVHNFEDGCKKWFKGKYVQFKGRKIILFGNAAKCEMMIKALTEVGMKENIVGITCNNSQNWGVQGKYSGYISQRGFKNSG